MGVADIIPGISGGTVALIFGIYHRLINTIQSFDHKWFKAVIQFDTDVILQRPDLPFLIPLATGILFSILFFTQIIPLPLLIYTYPEIIYGLFFGLILSSIFNLIQEARINSFKGYRFVIAGIAVGHLLFTMAPLETPNTFWFILLSGMLAISAMLLPGISGSFILLMLKKYTFILNAVSHFNFAIIIPFGSGMLLGLILFSRLLSWLLKHWYQEVLATMIGMLIASLRVIWPFQQRIYENISSHEKLMQSSPYIPEQLTANVAIAIAMIVIGLLLVMVLRKFSTYSSLKS